MTVRVRLLGRLILLLDLGEVHEHVIERHLCHRVILDHVSELFASALQNTEHAMQRHARRHAEVNHLVVLFFHHRLGDALFDVVDHALRFPVGVRSNENGVAITEPAERSERDTSAREALLRFQVLDAAQAFEFAIDHDHQTYDRSALPSEARTRFGDTHDCTGFRILPSSAM